jgi:hypothetical protein
MEYAGSLIVKYALEKAGSLRTLRAVRADVAVEFEVAGPASDELIDGTRVC